MENKVFQDIMKFVFFMPQSNKHICFLIWASEPGNYHKLVFVLIQLVISDFKLFLRGFMKKKNQPRVIFFNIDHEGWTN
jgi:hypothetical protein